MKRRGASFYHWRLLTAGGLQSGEALASAGTHENASITSATNPSDEASTQSLQVEIKKLHEQLASSKSEAWRYKRQLLKQFL